MKGTLAKIGCRPYYFGQFWKLGSTDEGSRGSYSLGLIRTRDGLSRSSGRTKRLPDHRVSGKDRRTRDLRVGCHFQPCLVSLSASRNQLRKIQIVCVCLSALPDGGRPTRVLHNVERGTRVCV